MTNFVNQFWNDENGFVLSAELVIILTVAVLGMIVGLSYVQTAVVSEFTDIAGAINSLNQNYAYTGFYSTGYYGKFKSYYSGSAYNSYRRGGAVLGYNGCEVDRGSNYSEELWLEQETVEEPCQICKPGEVQEGVIERPEADCPHCEVGKEIVIPQATEQKRK
ncbi:MAG: Flp family type IVb pilin [Planctomycetes bacterium]|nr:Flp family type IVb pilin [Planctomycetota bacterium]MCH9775033.1 Flp family type IVb pilin [Planctomycetota bacterium]MDF1746940.1 Flp family type IVb pilin [Gimesia sp.]